MQLNHDQTEMILIATKTILHSDAVQQYINPEGSDIKPFSFKKKLFFSPIALICDSLRVCALNFKNMY